MKKHPKETLLRDVLREASGGIRQEIFEASLKELRQRKRGTKTWLALPLAIAAAFVLIASLLLFEATHRTKESDLAQQAGSIQTAGASSYPQMEIVMTTGQGMAVVESHRFPSLIVQNSSVQQPIEILSDTELLALFPDKASGLIKSSEGVVQLVFLDSQQEVFQQ